MRPGAVFEIEEVEVKSIAVPFVGLVACASVPAMAAAQEPVAGATSGYHHSVHHPVHNRQHDRGRRFEAHNPAPASATSAAAAAGPQAAPFGLALPHIAPYPNGKGDADGLSEDQDDCNKGCIDGNTPN
jgi:hypothetical protein